METSGENSNAGFEIIGTFATISNPALTRLGKKSPQKNEIERETAAHKTLNDEAE